VAVYAWWRDESGKAIEQLQRRQELRAVPARTRLGALAEQVLGIALVPPVQGERWAGAIAQQAHEPAQQAPAHACLHVGDGGGIEAAGGMEDEPARRGVEYAVDDDTVKMELGIEVGTEAVDDGHRAETGGGTCPRAVARRQDSTARRKSCKVELLKDISARWETGQEIRELAGCAAGRNAPICAEVRVPQAEIYSIDVSFAALAGKAERDYLNQQPTTFVLPAEAVDRLRAVAGTIIMASP
jgi:hypothetical protein